MRRTIFRLLPVLVFLSISTHLLGDTFRPPRPRRTQSSGEQRKKIQLKEEMSPQQYRRSGLHKLSAQERKNLEVWMSKWRQDEIESERTNLMAIERIQEGGRLIVLSDGSSWRVSPFSTRLTRRWASDHRIEVHSTGRLGKSYKLKNVSVREEANAELVSGPSELGDGSTYRIDRIGRGGDSITLEDGSSWKISLIERSRVRRWQIGQYIEVQGHFSRGQKGELYNLDARESVNATLLYGPRRPRTVTAEEEIEELEEVEEVEQDGEPQDIHENWRWRRNQPLHRPKNPQEQQPHGSSGGD